MNSRSKKFLSYYKPYRGLLVADLVCAFAVSIITLILPLCARYITNNILEGNVPNALGQIYTMGVVMLALVVIYALCNTFVDYQGHMMGAMMERDMQGELFEHYQKLSFSFYDEQKTGQLMNRITNDTFALGELYHHGPEDIVLSCLKFFGTFIILMMINVSLTLIVFLFLPIMAIYAFYFNRTHKLKIHLRASGWYSRSPTKTLKKRSLPVKITALLRAEETAIKMKPTSITERLRSPNFLPLL